MRNQGERKSNAQSAQNGVQRRRKTSTRLAHTLGQRERQLGVDALFGDQIAGRPGAGQPVIMVRRLGAHKAVCASRPISAHSRLVQEFNPKADTLESGKSKTDED